MFNRRNDRRPMYGSSFEELFVNLESRTLLSAVGEAISPLAPALAEGVARVAWRGLSIEASPGSWLLTTSEPLTQQEWENRISGVMSQVGIDVLGVKRIGLGYTAQFDVGSSLSIFTEHRLRGIDPIFSSLEPDVIYQPMRTPNDPDLTSQWFHDNSGQLIPGFGFGTPGADISSLEAWDITIGSREVIVAVIDTGVDYTHPDLAANIWRNPNEIPGNGIDDDGNGFIDDVFGWDFGENNNDPMDVDGHGTGAAGLIGAVGNNGIGRVGVAWEVSILPMKIANQFGQLTLSAIVGSHDYLTMMITDFGHNIVASNNSYRAIAGAFYADAPEGFSAERDAIQRFILTGAAFVAGAGNDTLDNDSNFAAFPASYNLPGIISVAATAPDDTLAFFSNYGARTVALAAPGISPGSLAPGGGYQPYGGTSAASPIVAGAVALYKTIRPDASGQEVRNTLIASVDSLPALQNLTVSGGRLNVARMLQIAGIDGPVVRRIEPGPFGNTQDPFTGLLIDQAVAVFNKNLDASVLSASTVTLTYAGIDGILGTADDQIMPITAVRLPDPATDQALLDRLADGEAARTIVAKIDIASLPDESLAPGVYSLRIRSGTSGAPLLRDSDGNLLNGTVAAGSDELYQFTILSETGNFEPNDTLAQATPVPFNVSGKAVFGGLFLGDGVRAGLDVDLFRLDLARGGLISAKVIAQRLNPPSSLDAMLRLFNAQGDELTSNDQADGFDPAFDFFVTTGGTYYVGVSGFPNDIYNPFMPGSGRTQSTGAYTLQFEVELIGDSRFPPVSPNLQAPIAIPDNGQITSTVYIPDARQILDVNLRVDIEHTFVGDLRVQLVSPSGQSVVVANRHGGSSQNMKVLFDDEAVTSVIDKTPPLTGTLRPASALSLFDGESAEGTWTLIVSDNRGGDVGQLIDWSLELTLSNNIFGPFELNDTLATAAVLDGINGTGIASLEAVIGDGGFGLFDRDIFRFTAVAGATLNAVVTSLGSGGGNPTLNTALRLFDGQGNPLLTTSPVGTLNSSIESFVFPDGGTFYIAVSEANNTSYNPTSVTSGRIAQTTGAYRLSMAVTPGVSDSTGLMVGSKTQVGIANDGTFLGRDAFGRIIRLSFDGIEFIGNEQTPTLGTSFFGAVADGASFLNDGSGSAASLPLSLTDQSDFSNNRMNALGRFRDLRVERTVSFGVDDRFVAVDVSLTNDGTTSIAGIAWMEGFNPNHGYSQPVATPNTINDIDDTRPYASARVVTNTLLDGKTIALAGLASDDRARVDFIGVGTQLRDPSILLALPQTDPNGINADQVMVLSYDLGTIDPGQTQTMRYFILVEDSPSAALGIYDAINEGTTVGHLAADTANPATVPLSDGTQVPALPFRAYYPEGFASSTTSHFMPMLNPHNQPTRVVVVARYEDRSIERDSLIADLVIPAQQRSGITITTPSAFANGRALVRTDLLSQGLTAGYAIEVWSERPISTTFSYYDEFNAGQSALGETFTSQPSTDWAFPEVIKGSGRTDVVVFQNTTAQTIKVQATFLTGSGPLSIRPVFELEPFRRGGFNLADISSLPEGTYAMLLETEGNIVAALSSFDSGAVSGKQSAGGLLGAIGNGSSSGVIPEGQIGLNGTRESVGVVNPNTVPVNVEFTFVFQSGNAFRTSKSVAPQSRTTLDVTTLSGFPKGEPYAVSYTAADAFGNARAVALSLPTDMLGDINASSFGTQAYSYWAFGEGFRPADPFSGNVTEYIRLFNPNQTAIVAEVQIRFDGFFTGTTLPLGQETFRFTIPARRVIEVDVHELVTGARRDQDTFYGLTVRSSNGLVAYMGRFDSFFSGGFGTLGTALGRATNI